MAVGGDSTLERERDFYRRLLELGDENEIEPLLDQALALIVGVTGARLAYLELHDDTPSGPPRFWKSHGARPPEVEHIRDSISRGIIARAVLSGETVETPSALDDTRFQDLRSVRQHEIQAVLCAPIGKPPLGVVYLQGRTREGPFTDEDRGRAEMFARQLARLADRLLARRSGAVSEDKTRDIRARFSCARLIGRSAALAHILQQAALVAPLDVDVLITGASGTGKTAVAHAIADNSRRAGKPFVAINCAAIPDTLLESELFGAERGAHSTATRKIAGKVAAAEGGTLFLDEVGELSLAAQAKLLHLLQAREYHPLGATSAVRADVRVLSATNVDLRQLVASRRFREDLYYRLHVLPLHMPDLSERREDIPELAEHAREETCRRHNLAPLTMSQRALFACREATWSGNVRELVHAIEAAVIRATGEGSAIVLERHVFPGSDPGGTAGDAPLTFQEATRRFQQRYVRERLEQNDWNVAETARQLDVTRSHLYNLINGMSLRRSGRDSG